MQIESIKLSKEELNQAVREFLKVRGITVEIESVDTYGYPARGWQVEVKETAEPEPEYSVKTIMVTNPPNPAVL